MRNAERDTVRIEVVTRTFVAIGRPDGASHLGWLLETLNNPAASRHIDLHDASLRSVHRTEPAMRLQAPLVVRRDDIVFASFEGPDYAPGVVRPPVVERPVLLLAPPFQILGSVFFTPEADTSRALRSLVHGFFLVRHARVFSIEGDALGDGDQVVVNGAQVQMTTIARQHIAPARATKPATRRRAPASGAAEAAQPDERRTTRAA